MTKPTMPEHEFAQHQKHGWSQVSVDHIHNVPLLQDHFLMSCPCKFYGWVAMGRFS